MDDNTSNNKDINVILDAGQDNIKYYECDNTNCIFEIVDKNGEDNEVDNLENRNIDNESIEGEIIVITVLDYGKHEYLQGAKINLYRINGLSPILIDSQKSNETGKVIFKNIKKGCYRIIEIIDKRYFEKPKYVNWNEIIIDEDNLKQKVLVVNKLNKNKRLKV